jgi:hypothetical protein
MSGYFYSTPAPASEPRTTSFFLGSSAGTTTTVPLDDTKKQQPWRWRNIFYCMSLLAILVFVLFAAVFSGLAFQNAYEVNDLLNAPLFPTDAPEGSVKRSDHPSSNSVPGQLNIITWLQQENQAQTQLLQTSFAQLQEYEEMMSKFISNKLTFSEHNKYAACDTDIGLTNITASMIDVFTTEFQRVLDHDTGRFSNISFFPGIAGQFPNAVTGGAAPLCIGILV